MFSVIPNYVAFDFSSILLLFERCLEIGILTAFAILPILAISASQKGYIFPICITLLYVFAGLFMSMSNTARTFYPITAIFGISGYYETTIQNYICSLGILILCGCISAILLKNLNHRQRKKANE